MFVICFISQWMKRSKHGLFVFLPKKIVIWRRHCSIGPSCCSMTSKRSISIDFQKVLGHKVFSPEHSPNQPKATRVCIRSTNQSNHCNFVRLYFNQSVLFARFHFKVIRKFLKECFGSGFSIQVSGLVGQVGMINCCNLQGACHGGLLAENVLNMFLLS